MQVMYCVHTGFATAFLHQQHRKMDKKKIYGIIQAVSLYFCLYLLHFPSLLGIYCALVHTHQIARRIPI